MKAKVNSLLDKIFEKPIIGIPFAIAVFYIIWFFVGKIGTTIITKNIIRIIAGIIMSAFFIWFRGDGIYSCGIKKRGIKGCLFVLPVVILFCLGIIIRIVTTPDVSPKLFLYAGIMAVEAGFCEEMMVRFFPLGNTLWRQKSIKGIIQVSIYSSVIFGLLHIGNVAITKDFASSGMQALADVCAGLFLVAVYLRTGSIIPGIICHSLWDFLLMFDPKNLVGDDFAVYGNVSDTVGTIVQESGLTEQTVHTLLLVAQGVAMVVIGSFWIVLTCIMLRKSKRNEIMENFER